MPGFIRPRLLQRTDPSWQLLRNSLVPGAYTPGTDFMATGAATVGVSPDFDSIKTVVTSSSQSVLDDAGATTTGFISGRSYTGYEVALHWTPPTGAGTITFRNCRFIGPASYASSAATGLVRLFNAGHVRCEFYDCTFKAQNPLPQQNGPHGFNFLLRRCDISYVSDGLSTFRPSDDSPAGNVLVDWQQCWVHDLVWMSQADCAALGISTPADGMHNDVIQHQGGEGLICKYNRMDATTAPEFFNDHYDSSGAANGNITYQNVVGLKDAGGATIFGTGSVQFADIRFNLLTGGRSQVNYTTGAAGNLSNVGTYQSNRHEPDYTVLCINRPSGTISPFTCDFGAVGPPDTRNKLTTGALAPQSNSGQ